VGVSTEGITMTVAVFPKVATSWRSKRSSKAHPSANKVFIRKFRQVEYVIEMD
jgi:hypothetical protein